jgi:hypothetical protein
MCNWQTGLMGASVCRSLDRKAAPRSGYTAKVFVDHATGAELPPRRVWDGSAFSSN